MMRRLFLILGALWAGAPAAQPALVWERVGTTPYDHETAYPVSPGGELLQVLNDRLDDGLFRLPAPFDSTTEWEMVSPSPRSFMFWGYALGRDTLLVEAHLGIYRSVDGGVTWDLRGETVQGAQVLEVPPGLPHAGRIVVTRRSSIMAVYSSDRGASWYEATRLDSADAERIAVVTAGPRAGRLVAAGLSGITASDDGGATWARTPEWAYFQMDVNCVATLRGQAPGGGDRLVAVVNDIRVPTDSVYVTLSDDGGDTWQRGQGLRYGSFPTCVEAVDLGDGRAVVVLSRGPVWGTEDGGATWAVWSEWAAVAAAAQADPARARAKWAMVGPDGRLYVGMKVNATEEAFDVRTSVAVGPVTDYPDDPGDPVEAEPSPEAGSGLALAVRPNPVSSRTEVVVRLGIGSTPTEAVVTVHDAQGREVARLRGAVTSEQVFRLDTSGWAAGVYVVRVATDTEAATASFTVVR